MTNADVISLGGEKLEGMALDAVRLPRFIHAIEQRFGSSTYDKVKGAYDETKMLGKIARRVSMLHCLPSEDPKLPPPFELGPKYQSDAPRRVHGELLARLCENGFQAKARLARDSAVARQQIDAAEEVFNAGIQLMQDQLGIDIQASLASNLIAKAYGVLHWNRRPWIYPDVPDYDYLDDLPDDEEEKKRFEPNPEYTKDSDDPKHSKRFREKSDSLRARRNRDKAGAGFPYYFEVIDPENFMFVEDRSLENGFGAVLLRREVGLLDYEMQLQGEKLYLSLNDAAEDIPIYGERDAPADYMPSGQDYGAKVTLYQLWTRDEFYEVVAGVSENGSSGTGGWRVMKAMKHSWGMPPFSIAPAAVIDSPDPVLKYEPALEGVYRVLPHYNLQMALYMALSWQVALPEYVIERDAAGIPPLGEDGADTTLSRNSAEAEMLPPGAKLTKLDFQLNEAVIRGLELMAQNLDQAKPPTGRADVSASTQPWAIRLQQAQENVEPARYLKNIDRCINIAVRSIARDIAKPAEEGGFGEGVYVYKRIKGGGVDYDTLVGIEPEDIRTLDFYVETSSTSQAEAITKQEHGRTLLEAKLITKREFFEDYLLKPKPVEHQIALDVEEIMDTYVKPGIVVQEVNAALGMEMTLGPDGKIYGVGGQQFTPEQFLETNGVQPPVQIPRVGPQQVRQPGMGSMNVPGTIPVGGPAA